MRISSLFGPATAGFSTVLWTWLLLSRAVNAFSFTSVSEPDLDLSSLGRVELVGDFDAASLYSYKEQSETQSGYNGSQSLLTPLPNGIITNLSTADSHIFAVCSLADKNGSDSRIFVGGNFTNIGGVRSPGIALFKPNSTKITPLPGLNGSVSALLCDQESNTVYVGGDFKRENSSNAAIWNESHGLSKLSFGGFNGPITSILKEKGGHIVFGGSFDGLGNSTSSQKKEQIVNLQNATVTSVANSPSNDYGNPRNVICQTSGKDGPGKTWLLNDHTPGFWEADMRFSFNPTKLRLYNTHLDGRGTKTFLFKALPDNGIMNLTYSDPTSGKEVSCDAACPLSNNKSEIHRDFKFVNNIGMGGFQIELLDWYGAGAGLNGIELIQDDIVAYAINDFNEPACANVDYPSGAIQKGSWTVANTVQGQSDYLTAQVSDSNATSASVTFEPDIKRPGNYSVLMYTPGCMQDWTCNSRGIVNVTGAFASSTESAKPFQTNIYQTNNGEKYDTIYTGYVEASSDSFRPHVTISRLDGQGDITMVASRVKFELKSATGGLNGIYEHDPSVTNTTSSNFARSAIDRAGNKLDNETSIRSLAQNDGVIYAGGNFTGPGIRNIMSFDNGNATAMPQEGLNSQVNSMLAFRGILYVGGNFTDTGSGKNGSLQHVAAYSFASKSWSALGGGVNGRVDSVLSFPLNVSKEINETTVAVSGSFDQILPFGSSPPTAVSGFAIWVPSQKNWLQNLNVSQLGFAGQLTAIASVNDTNILAGTLTSEAVSSSNAVSLRDSNGLSLVPLSTELRKDKEGSGVFTGVIDRSSGRNLTILGGHFNTTSSNGSTVENLLLLDGKSNSHAIGLGPGVESNSTFLSLAVSNNTLYAGGNITGSVGDSKLNGFVFYDLSAGKVIDKQPPSLTGSNAYVNSIAARPHSTDVYFGGHFEGAGSLPCPSVCIYDSAEEKWSAPGVGLTGTVLSLRWASSKELMVVGDLSVQNNKTTVATYNAKSQAWSSFDGASSSDIPGTITAFTPASEDISKFWLAGTSPNGTSFLMNYDGSKFQSADNLFSHGTSISDLEVLPVSKKHSSTRFLKEDMALLVTGRLVISNFGNASAALFNGTTLSPFILTSSSGGQPGKVSQLFTEKENTYSRKHDHHHSNGIVVLISFCLALGCVFLIVIAGVIFNKIQRRRQGYVSAPQAYPTDRRPSAMNRLPPEYLFNSLRQPNPGAPTI